jgi:hypothetical protein
MNVHTSSSETNGASARIVDSKAYVSGPELEEKPLN